MESDPEQILGQLQTSTLTTSLVFIGVGLLLTLLVGSNLARPFGEIVQVLQGVRRGRLDRRVRVTSNDEIGYTGDVINDMTEGLAERERMRQSLDLAREVQQSLLPEASRVSDSLDLAGRSVYCDQTGGDYFDYFDLNPTGSDRVGLVVGDVSDHGIPSALLMATARGFLRLRASITGSVAEVVTDVNRHLTRDVEETGQFMTLLYLVVDTGGRTLTWVRAGHDPGFFYDPSTDAFTDLDGPGIALGLDPDETFVQNHRERLAKGQVIVLLTDGVWEACNAAGEMFGKSRVRDLIRKHHRKSAMDMVDALFSALSAFRQGVASADDATFVVAKVTA